MAATRRIVMFNRVSAEGYFTAGDGKLDWTVPDPTLDQQAASRLAEPGTMLFGRKTYDMFESFWPKITGDAPTAPNPHAPGASREMKAMADWINASEKLVFSRTKKGVTWNNSQLFHELDPEAVAALKQKAGPDIMVFGSGSIVSQLTAHGLIDEYQFVVSPVLLGTGRPPIADVPKRTMLNLVEAKAYPAGNVMLRYAPKA
jgi:dihydrofolate reductase